MGDLRYAVRALLQNGLTTAAAVVSLALGIGANVALFAVFNAIVFKPLPARDPGRLANVYASYPDGARYGTSSWPDYVDYRERNHVFEGLAAWHNEPVNLGANNSVERVLGSGVSANYFSVLGLAAAPGRVFREEDARERVAVISDSLWRSKFSGNTDVAGRKLRINDQDFVIIGVAPAGFQGLEADGAGVWFPLVLEDAKRMNCRDCNWLQMTGRLKPGVTHEQAEAELRILAQTVEQAGHKGATIAVTRGSLVTPRDVGQISRLFGLIFGALGVILLIACANVANILLARAAGRGREIGVRLALGASRSRLVRQMLTESMVLALAAGAAGLLFSLWAVELVRAIQLPGDHPFAPNLAPDVRVLGLALLLSLLTGVLFGLVPALRGSRPDIMDALRQQNPGGERSRLRTALVAGQVALSMVLLVSAGLLLRGFQRALTLDPGFASERVVAVPLDLHLAGYDAVRAASFYRQLEASLENAPGVRSVSFARIVPVGGKLMNMGITRNPSERFRMVSYNIVTPTYFRTLAIPILKGRELTSRDDGKAPAVALINETMARSFFGGEDPVGNSFYVGDDRIQVVGIVKDTRYLRLGETQRPHYYLPLAQQPDAEMTLLVEAASAPSSVIPAVRAAVQQVDPRLPVLSARTLAEQVRLSLWDSRQGAVFAAAFGGVALLLAAVGLYGVVSYTMSRRTREIGIRMALGAAQTDVMGMVVRQGLARVGIGLAFGIAGSAAAGQVLRKFLYGLSPADPVAWIGVSLMLTLVAMAASWLPARRASRVDPVVALRYE